MAGQERALTRVESGQRRFDCSWEGRQEKGNGGSQTPETSRLKEWGGQGQVEVSNGKCQGGGELSSDRAGSPVARLTPLECVCIWQRLGLKITGSLVKERMGGHGRPFQGGCCLAISFKANIWIGVSIILPTLALDLTLFLHCSRLTSPTLL